MNIPENYTGLYHKSVTMYELLNMMNNGMRSNQIKYIRDKNGNIHEWRDKASLDKKSITFNDGNTTLQLRNIENVYGLFGQDDYEGGRKSSKRRSLRRSKKQRKSRKYKK